MTKTKKQGLLQRLKSKLPPKVQKGLTIGVGSLIGLIVLLIIYMLVCNVIAVREDIFSNISIEKDGVVINFGRNITGTYWLDVVDNYKILFKVAGNRSLMIKLVHSLFYAKHYQN